MEPLKSSISIEDIERWFKAYHSSLCHTVYRIVLDWDTSQDIVQELFIKIWKKKDGLIIETSPQAYLKKAATNAALNYLESQKTQGVKGKQPLEQAEHRGAPDTDKVAQEEFEEVIRQALDRLPPKCRAIFVLSRFEGMKYQEIADHLGLSLKTVENQMGIALQKLRDDLKPHLSREYLISWAIGLIMILNITSP